jgi:hypothetical protein
MRIRGMRFFVHRGQVLLLLAVGLLAGVAIAGVCLQLDGASILGTLRVNQLLAPPRPALPTQIVIGRAVAPSRDSGLGGAAPANPATAATAAPIAPIAANPARPVANPVPPQPVPTTAVVPAVVYTYPPDDHGGGSGGGGRDGGGSGSGR